MMKKFLLALLGVAVVGISILLLKMFVFVPKEFKANERLAQ